MKKIIAIILMLAMMLTVVSCGNTGNFERRDRDDNKSGKTEAEDSATKDPADTEDIEDSEAEEDDADESAVDLSDCAVSGDNYELTAGQMKYIFYSQYNSFINTLEMYGLDADMYFDSSKPLSEQECTVDESKTWYEYFMDIAVSQAEQTLALCEAARANGILLTETDMDSIDSTIDTLIRLKAEEEGVSSKSYIKDTYGKGVTEKDIRAVLEAELLSSAYLEKVEDEADVSSVAIQAYYEENADYYDIESGEQVRSVRHILFSKDDYSNDTKAKEVYNKWLKDGAKVSDFEKLVKEYSKDPGSNTNGGLYENVEDGQMVEEFNDWLFDEDRTPGDHGIVETTYGWHIMYYEGERPLWEARVTADIRYEASEEATAEAVKEYEIEVVYDLLERIED